MGREFPTDKSQPSNIISFDNESVTLEGTSNNRVTYAMDSQLGDGSYFKLVSLTDLSFYNSSDVLQWSVEPSDIEATATSFSPFAHLDYNNDTVYMTARYGAGGTQILGVITISTGAVSSVGSLQATGILPNLSTSNSLHPSTKSGDIITLSYKDGKRYTVNVSTGIYDTGTQFEDDEFVLSSCTDTPLVNVQYYDRYGVDSSCDQMLWPFSTNDDDNFYTMAFGDYMYFSQNGYRAEVGHVKKGDFKVTMERIGKTFVHKNMKIAWGAE